MAAGSTPPLPCRTSLECLHKQTAPPAQGSSARFEFGEIRKCHKAISAVVSGMETELIPTTAATSQRRASTSTGEKEEMSVLRSEVKRQSEGQEDLKVGQEELKLGQEELKEQVQDLKTSFSKSMGDLTSDQVFTSYSLGRLRSLSNSRPAQEFEDFSSAYSSVSCVANLEECLTRELLKMGRQMERIEVQGQQLSDEVRSLHTRVQHFWTQPHDSVSLSHNLPPHITAFCHNIVDVIHIRVYDLATHLGVFESFVTRGSFRNLFWRVIVQWSSDCKERCTVPLLETLIHACHECGIPHPLDVEPMPMGDRRVLERNYSFLAEHVIVPVVLTYLRDSGMLTSDLVRYVLEPEPRPEKVTRLVDIMTVFGKHALHLLKEALRRSGQGHIVDGLVHEEEALDPAATLSAIPDAPIRLRESLRYQLGEISALPEQVILLNQLCDLSTGTYWTGSFLNMEVSVKISYPSRDAVFPMMEANQLRRLNHKHVLKLLAVVKHANPPWIVCESVQGDLLTHVRGLQGKDVSFSRILNMTLQVCKGMEYLEAKQCIHGDLRAENVLIMRDGRTLKVANFIVRPPESMMNSDSKGQGSTSVRWSSPETLLNDTMSTKADVWAFGVLLWELCTLGLVPYPTMCLEEVEESVRCGHVMPRPLTDFPLPDSVYDVMIACWHFYPSKRPSFRQTLSLLAGARSKESRHSDVTEAHELLSRRRSTAHVRRSSTTRPKSYHFEGSHIAEPTPLQHHNDQKQQPKLKKKTKNIFQKLSFKKKEKSKGATTCFYAALDEDDDDSAYKPA